MIIKLYVIKTFFDLPNLSYRRLYNRYLTNYQIQLCTYKIKFETHPSKSETKFDTSRILHFKYALPSIWISLKLENKSLRNNLSWIKEAVHEKANQSVGCFCKENYKKQDISQFPSGGIGLNHPVCSVRDLLGLWRMV